jgi:phage terminase large subunit-like protein
MTNETEALSIAKRVQTIKSGMRALEELAKRKAETEYLRFFDDDNPRKAYETQRKALESWSNVVVIFGGNQTGKSKTLLHLDAWDLTGNYPADYKGFRFHHPVDMWIVGESNELTRDSLQKVLFGPDSEKCGVGGLIPPNLIEGKPTKRHNVPGSFDTVRVKHVSGGWSSVTFKSYAQGRTGLQAWTGHVVHVDEEPPMDCWVELMMRLVAKRGRMRMSFTNLSGWSDVVDTLMDEENKDVDRFFLGALEAKHLGQEHIDRVMAMNLPEDEMRARLYGEPPIKTGKIFKIRWDDVKFPRFPIPKTWKTLGSLDPGFDHPTALVQGWKCPDTGVIFIGRTYRKSGLVYFHHAREMKEWKTRKWMHDPATNQSSIHTGKTLTELFNIELQPDWQYIPPIDRILQMANNDREPGCQKLQELFECGKLLIFDDEEDLLKELKDYERKKDGTIKKEKDDLIDALRYLAMADETQWEVFGEAPAAWWVSLKENPQAQTCQPGY